MLNHGLIGRHLPQVFKAAFLIVLNVNVIFAKHYVISPCSVNKLYSGSQWCKESHGGCSWRSTDGNKVFLDNTGEQKGYALLCLTIHRVVTVRRKFCVNFANFIRHGEDDFTLDAIEFQVFKVNTTTSTWGVIQPYCFIPETHQRDLTFILKASCVDVASGSYIANLSFTDHELVTTPFTALPTVEGTPTPIGDIQYVGVVVGAICIALFTLFSCLTIISARRSTSRESRRREVQHTCNEQDDRPDVVADNAPPSYDAVMACPDMYPATPQSTPPGTPDTTPHLSLHRRVLLNQLSNSVPASPQSQRHSIEPAVSEVWNEEQDPPPPYPGLAGTSGSGEVTNGSSEDTNVSDAGEGTLVISNTDNVPHTSDSQSDLAPTIVQDSGPWVLNNTWNNPRVNNSRNLRQSENDERNSQELAPRTDRMLAERIDDINEVEINNSRNRRENAPKTDNSVTDNIPQLTVV